MARALLREESTVTVKEADLGLAIAPDAEASYVIRQLTVGKIRDINQRHTRTRRGREVTDTDAVNRDLLDYVIVSWSGVTNGTGAPAPCDSAHKLLLPLDVQVGLLDRAQVGLPTEADRQDSFRPTS